MAEGRPSSSRCSTTRRRERSREYPSDIVQPTTQTSPLEKLRAAFCPRYEKTPRDFRSACAPISIDQPHPTHVLREGRPSSARQRRGLLRSPDGSPSTRPS